MCMIFKPVYIFAGAATIFLINTYIFTFLLKKEEGGKHEKTKQREGGREKKKRKKRRRRRTAAQISDSKPFNIFKTRTLDIRKAKTEKQQQRCNKKTRKE